MRKVTQQAANALLSRLPASISNTNVTVIDGVARMYLHGNIIATYDGTTLMIGDAGWRSVTTKERLNGILDVAGRAEYVYQKAGDWYVGGALTPAIEWDGMLTLRDGEGL